MGTAGKIYLASALGQAESTKPFMRTMERALEKEDFEVLNPWRKATKPWKGRKVARVEAAADPEERTRRLSLLNTDIGRANENAIRASDHVVALLDGVDVGSGTASEIGFAYALGKRVLGLRTDARQASENEAATVNLQLEYFINASGGRVVRSLSELRLALAELRAETKGN